MSHALRILGLVPARGGSKGVPGKNIAPLAGRPVIAYTLAAAQASSSLARCIVSTDDVGIAEEARRWGGDVPFMRPPELATDEAAAIGVVQHALGALAETYDAVMLLQPTSPLRSSADIDAAAALIQTSPEADSVISVVAVGDHHPARMKYIEDGYLKDPPFAETSEGQRRQDLPDLYLRNGAIYLTRVPVLLKQRSFKGRACLAYRMPPERSVNIDTPFDLLLAAALLAGRTVKEACP